MKNNYLIFIAFFVFSFTNAQIVDIPDANFKTRLTTLNVADLNGDGSLDGDVDTNDDGEIQVTEAEAVYRLRLFGGNINSVEGIAAFVNMTNLEITLNNITDLDLSNNTDLELLTCSNNQLSTLNVSGLNNLERIWCEDNNLTTIDLSGLLNLTELRCQENLLTALDVTDSPSLIYLYCYDNLISSLNITGLTELYYLSCSGNQLSELNLDSIVSLNYLNCDNNQLDELDLNDVTSLTQLYCNNNQLTNLDLSGLDLLIEVLCSDNQLMSLDLQDSVNLNLLFCQNNNLQELILKNGSSMQSFSMDLSNNLGLAYVCVDDFELNQIQNLMNTYNYTNVILNSYCSFTPGGEFYTIEGRNHYDFNNDGCDIDDIVVPNLKYNITNGSIDGTIISNTSGDYSIAVSEGAHNITPVLENPDYFTVNPTNITINFPAETSPYNQDFCVVSNGTHNDLEITIFPLIQARPGFVANYKIVYKNKGNMVLNGSVDLVFQDDVMDWVSANPNVDNQVQNELSWNFIDLLPFESREIIVSMNLNAPTDASPLNEDDVLVFETTINPIASDETPGDNLHVLNQTVVNSLDPNDKTCLEGKTIELSDVGKYVHYLIRFENTGTANAINIVVKDEIDTSKYDVSTLIPLNGSHEFVTRIKENNIVEFIFEDINLPFDDANNDGYVLFKIKTLENLTLGDTFSNDAEIYFDYNAPIITNDELTTVAENLSTEESAIQATITIYPNPATEYIHIESKNVLNSVTIYDVNGRQLQTYLMSGKTATKINVNNLSKGVYFLKIKTIAGEQTSKVIKE